MRKGIEYSEGFAKALWRSYPGLKATPPMREGDRIQRGFAKALRRSYPGLKATLPMREGIERLLRQRT